MRFTKPATSYGERRVRSFFAWLPVKILYRSAWQRRWLERVTVEEVFQNPRTGDYRRGWRAVRFIDPEPTDG